MERRGKNCVKKGGRREGREEGREGASAVELVGIEINARRRRRRREFGGEGKRGTRKLPPQQRRRREEKGETNLSPPHLHSYFSPLLHGKMVPRSSALSATKTRAHTSLPPKKNIRVFGVLPAKNATRPLVTKPLPKKKKLLHVSRKYFFYLRYIPE